MADTSDAERQIRGAKAAIADFRSTVSDLADDAVIIMQEFAPKLSGRLARSISATVTRNSAVITADARDPRTGFDYTAITRYGHKVARIYPTQARRPASVVATRRARRTGSTAALAYPIGGTLHFFTSVKGYHPSIDWCDKALPGIQVEADRAMRALGQRLELHV